MSTGPNGEAAAPASDITLTEEEKQQIRDGGYKAAISLHYGGNDWATSQLEGLKATFKDLGIEIVATTDANFSAEQQVSDIENYHGKDPDVIISIPDRRPLLPTRSRKRQMKGSSWYLWTMFRQR